MKKHTFKGGIHPYDGKELSKAKPIKTLPAGDVMVYPLVQHIGAPAVAAVKPGDKVLMGQTIGNAGGFVSSNIISSVSGVVKAVEPRLTVSGNKVMSIIIENDHEDKAVDGLGKDVDYTTLTKEQIRAKVKDAGVVGMGGAGFPNHVKISPKDDSAIDYVIVNGAECEPYLTSDYRIMLEEGERVRDGLKVMLSLFENAKGIIAIEDNKPDCIEKMMDLCKDEERIEVIALKTKYPQGAERKLIYAATGRKINSSMLPSDAGCIVDNIDTVVAIYMAVCKTTPLMRRIITVTGDAVKEPQNFNVRIGLDYEELVKAAGGFTCEPEKIISGGPMMGMALFDIHIPVTKTSSALLAMSKDEVAASEPTNCIRCGRCIAACPSNLVPVKMLEYSDRFDEEGFVAIGGMECYECGSCTFVCPAKRRMTQSFKQMRRAILDKRRRG